MFMLFSLLGLSLGLALGHIFRAYVLLPTSPIAVVLVICVSLLQGQGPLDMLIEAVAIVTALQLGYLLGLLARPFSLRSWSLVIPTKPARLRAQIAIPGLRGVIERPCKDLDSRIA